MTVSIRQLEAMPVVHDSRPGPDLEAPPGQPLGRGELGDHYPGIEYFDLASSMFAAAGKEVLLFNGQMNGFPRADIERFRRRITALRERAIPVSLTPAWSCGTG